ncbi:MULTISPECIES: amidohydrolase family protein [unclassified Saccharopolyspora]|uniref:amidohydrolase family protein n=1 Tax=unclassified Saccharopolyspora TaxID=2646250 RepID=UPI001CD55101|nr:MULTISPECIES: amidohydrolase family protein [unclassified Saccharopolyspora]MCA1186985.1 amidohydrolase [Saccharopolyspora sp. 6T]MCA1192636.1 amidohydrolase [Saccharopolyspora sp. 6V]MCA1229632.1 amidohydrolase [Saccharopolyspora sp. 6M]MCA1283466.1 amidohydrolase [Saccharopolyspora sp. 7B]
MVAGIGVGTLIAAAAGFGLAATPRVPASTPSALVDHHLHIQGPAATTHLRRLRTEHGELATLSLLNREAFAVRTGEDAVRVLDAAGIGRGVLLSEAYMLGSAELVREENAFNVDAARTSRGRLCACVGVNPFMTSAVDELRHWAGQDGVVGAKLHLANSGFDPQSTDSVDRLVQIVRECRVLDLPLVIHPRHSPDYSREAADVLINGVLCEAEGLPVQIAHAGGWGGLDESTFAALQGYQDAIEASRPGTSLLQIDLAVVVQAPWADGEKLHRLVEHMRHIGVERFLMGSDWPAIASPGDHNRLLLGQLPLSESERRTVLKNVANYLGTAHA